MPDPTVILALLLLVVLVESSPLVRMPIGLVLAIGLLASGAELLPVVLVGILGVVVARVGLALNARRDRHGAGASSVAGHALRARLAGSAAFSRLTFLLAGAPGMPATFLFPLLGSMQVPLGPAIAGTLVGRTPVLALTTALFAWLGRIGAEDDAEAAFVLAVLAVVLLALRTVGRIDWQHRAQTGSFRLRDADESAARMTMMFGPGTPGDRAGTSRSGVGIGEDPSDADMVEGELLGEEVVEDQPSGDDDQPPPAIPPTGLAPT